MNSIQKLFYQISAIVIFIGAYVLTMWFVNMEEDREDYVISDQMKKTGVELNIDASGGSNVIPSSQVLTSLLSIPESVSVSVDGRVVSYEEIYNAIARGASLNGIVPSGNYIAYYSYDSSGIIHSIHYKRVP